MGFSAAADMDNLAINQGVLPIEAFTMCIGDFQHIHFLQSKAVTSPPFIRTICLNQDHHMVSLPK
jgi:hypothetical protein